MQTFQAIILAAGSGKRLQTLTKSIPKCLIPIGKTTILDRQIDILFRNGISEIIVVAGYKANLIRKHIHQKNIRVILNNKFEKTDTLYSVYCAKKYIKNNFLCLYGDLVFDEKLILSLLQDEHNGSIIVDKPVEKFNTHSVIIKNSQIQRINLPKFTKKINGQFIGISKFTGSYVAWFKKILDSFSNNNTLEGEFVRIIESFVEKGISIHACSTSRLNWVNVNDLQKLTLVQEIFN